MMKIFFKIILAISVLALVFITAACEPLSTAPEGTDAGGTPAPVQTDAGETPAPQANAESTRAPIYIRRNPEPSLQNAGSNSAEQSADGTLTPGQIAKIDSQETYEQRYTDGNMEIESEWVPGYESFAEMLKDTPYVVEVEIINTQNIVSEYEPDTVSEARVLSCQKGGLKVGDIILVAEAGGYYDKTSSIAEAGEPVVIGVPVMETGQKLVLFLRPHRTDMDYPLGKYIDLTHTYVPMGTMQGKFIQRSGYVFQQAMKEFKFEEYSPEPVAAFKSNMAAGKVPEKTATETYEISEIVGKGEDGPVDQDVEPVVTE